MGVFGQALINIFRRTLLRTVRARPRKPEPFLLGPFALTADPTRFARTAVPGIGRPGTARRLRSGDLQPTPKGRARHPSRMICGSCFRLWYSMSLWPTGHSGAFGCRKSGLPIPGAPVRLGPRGLASPPCRPPLPTPPKGDAMNAARSLHNPGNPLGRWADPPVSTQGVPPCWIPTSVAERHPARCFGPRCVG